MTYDLRHTPLFFRNGRIFCETLNKEYRGLRLRRVRRSHSSHRRKRLKTYLGVFLYVALRNESHVFNGFSVCAFGSQHMLKIEFVKLE
jgi:hypothetical protein